MDKKIKISATAYRVLLLLLHLNNGNCSAEYLNKIFSDDEYVSRYFSKDVILKYISTLRSSGYSISKPKLSNNYNYELDKSPVLLELTNKQIKNIAVMTCYAKSMYQSKLTDNYNNFLRKLKRIIPDKQVQLLNKEIKKECEKMERVFLKYAPYENLIKKIENFIIENQRVCVKYQIPGQTEGKEVVLEIRSIKYDQNEVYISGYNLINEQTHYINLKQIVDIRQLPTKSQYSQILSPIIFKLKGKLARVYRPYENEKMTTQDEMLNSITVTSYADDKDMLFKRLLKYGENCEVIYPKHAQNDMAEIINRAIKNYE